MQRALSAPTPLPFPHRTRLTQLVRSFVSQEFLSRLRLVLTSGLILGTFIPRSSWSLAEANVGIICACLPMLRRPFMFIFPCFSKLRSKNTSASPGYNVFSADSQNYAWRGGINKHIELDGMSKSPSHTEATVAGDNASEEAIIGSEHTRMRDCGGLLNDGQCT